MQGLMLRCCLIDYVPFAPCEVRMLTVRSCVNDQCPWIRRESILLKLPGYRDCSIPQSRSAINPQRPISFLPIYGYCRSRIGCLSGKPTLRLYASREKLRCSQMRRQTLYKRRRLNCLQSCLSSTMTRVHGRSEIFCNGHHSATVRLTHARPV